MFLKVLVSVTLWIALHSSEKVSSFSTKININSNAIFKTKSFTKSTLQSQSSKGKESEEDSGIDIDSDPRLYSIELPRAPGIEWGTDLSFSFVYVRALEPGGAASLSGVEVNDQICQLRSINDKELGPPQNLVGASFDNVMNSFATLDKSISNVELIFFRGTKDELIQAATKSSDTDTIEEESDEITITVIQNKGSKDEKSPIIFKAEKGANIRKVLVDNGINVYQSITRWTNCSGKQLCGTCIVNVAEGNEKTNRKSMDEESTLRENPNTYRLSCVTFAYGDVVVETFPPIKAAQWTR